MLGMLNNNSKYSYLCCWREGPKIREGHMHIRGFACLQYFVSLKNDLLLLKFNKAWRKVHGCF